MHVFSSNNCCNLIIVIVNTSSHIQLGIAQFDHLLLSSISCNLKLGSNEIIKNK
jgi:hypothetical protein